MFGHTLAECTTLYIHCAAVTAVYILSTPCCAWACDCIAYFMWKGRTNTWASCLVHLSSCASMAAFRPNHVGLSDHGGLYYLFLDHCFILAVNHCYLFPHHVDLAYLFPNHVAMVTFFPNHVGLDCFQVMLA